MIYGRKLEEKEDRRKHQRIEVRRPCFCKLMIEKLLEGPRDGFECLKLEVVDC